MTGRLTVLKLQRYERFWSFCMFGWFFITIDAYILHEGNWEVTGREI